MNKKKKSLAFANLDFLNLLSNYSFHCPKQFRSLIKSANNNEINGLSEVVLNVLQGNLPCKKKYFKKHISEIRFVGDKLNPINKRREIVARRGKGFIGAILRLAIPALVNLFSKKI